MNNKKRCNARLYVRRPNMEARPPMRKYKLINYIDVNEMSNIYNLKKKHKLCPDITHNHIIRCYWKQNKTIQ